jgi:serpin B
MTVRRRPLALPAVVILVAGFLVAACGGSTRSAPETDATTREAGFVVSEQTRAEPGADARADVDALASGNNAFGLELFRTLRAGAAAGDNLVCSPYSLSAVLAMTFAGASGETEQEMARVLHFDLAQQRLHPAFNALDRRLAAGGELQMANALWGMADYPYNQTFLDLLAAQYGAGLGLVDFNKPEEARVVINDWISEHTGGRIPEMIPPGDIKPETYPWLMLTDAVYFKAEWEWPFPAESTHKREFTLLDGSRIDVSMMQRKAVLPCATGAGWQAVELPYEGETFSMVIILPDEGELETVIEGLDAGALDGIVAKLKQGKVELVMPRFGIESTPPVEETLKALGMKRMFELESDFNKMIDLNAKLPQPAGLGVGGVHQKAFIAVAEKGTEAAAASSVTMVAGTVTTTTEYYREIIVDRPFVYLIRDRESGQIVFLGQVTRPEEPTW